MTKNNPNLLIIYQDSYLPFGAINELEKSFQIKIVRKIKRISFLNYKKEGNRLISSYNHILFSTDSKTVFFICASELKEAIFPLLNFDSNEDFGFFKEQSNKLAEFLSGFFIKKDVLIKIGCFDRYVFNNFYLNFLINHFRFYHAPIEDDFFEPLANINSTNLFKYNFWSLFEDSFYQNQILYKDYYLAIKSKIHPIPKIPAFTLFLIDKFVKRNTFRWYW